MCSELRLLAALAISAGSSLLAPLTGSAFVTDGAWPTGQIPMRMQLNATRGAQTLIDGSASWNDAVTPAFAEWNAIMQRTQFASVESAATTASRGDGVSNVFFSSTIYGQAFGTRTLAVTATTTAGLNGLRYTESDVIFNSGRTWDSYRGPLRSATDIRRVALHEFGHVIGLLHPDEDTPAQVVLAIMNSTISDIYSAQPDDISGVQALYNGTTPSRTITRQPASQTVAVGANAALSFDLAGATPPAESATLKYAWLFTPTGGGAQEFLFTIHEPLVALGAAQLDDAGVYRVTVETPDGETLSSSATLTVTPVTKTPATRMANLSTRGFAGTAMRTLIVGFSVSGTQPRRVLLRAVGPTLASNHGVAGAIPDPVLDVVTQAGAVLATNDNWGTNAGGEAALATLFTQVGAFPFVGGSQDAAIVITLPPGVYTARATPKNGIEGVALVEAYDLDAATDSTGRLVNLSTRGFVGRGDNVLIGGIVVNGPGPRTFLLRAVGDTLQGYGVTGTLDDPVMTLFDGNQNRLRWVDDWDSPQFLQTSLQSTFTTVGAFALTDRQESVMRLTLQPGNYTVHVAGFEGAVGVALLEVYEVPE
jgi:hypothetical protein